MQRNMCAASFLIVVTCGFVVTSVATAAEATTGLRIRVGVKDKDPTDWSGRLLLSEGKVESIRGWRWTQADDAEEDTFTVGTRRAQPQSLADRKRVQAGGQMPMTDNGIIAILAGTSPATAVTFESAQGKVEFKVADVPYGKPMAALDGRVIVERVPASLPLAESNEDEDYPAVATGKDGTLALAYVSFKHGQDFQGARERPATPESGPMSGPNAAGPVRRIEKPEDFDYLAQPAGGDQIFLRLRRADGAWSDPVAVTDGTLELYRAAVAIDGSGKIWVFYSAHVGADATLDHGNWELFARVFDGQQLKPIGEPVNISNAAGSDFMPAATTDSTGRAHVTWVGGRERNFQVFVASQEGEKFSAPRRVSDQSGNEWEPAIAADAKGNVAVAWDTYAKGDYDIYLAQRSSDGSFGKPQPVAASLAFEVRPSLAYDSDGKLWIAWEESGDQWGKDWGALKKQGIPLYTAGRSLGVRVLAGDGNWQAPPDVMDAMPENTAARKPARGGGRAPAGARGFIAPCFPRLAAGPDGNVWLAFRGKPGGNWRVPTST